MSGWLRMVTLLSAMAVAAGCGSAQDQPTALDSSAREQLRDQSATFVGQTIDALRADTEALRLGGALFEAHCAQCHGSTGEGGQGVMNLVDGVFNYGGTAEAIRTTIADGRTSVMPAMGNTYGEMNLGQLVAYVESLASDEPISRLGEQGKVLFDEGCAKCHGADGGGNPDLGTPNLGDAYWLHGDTMMAIRLIITRGAEGQCPAQGPSLSAVEIDLLTAYVTNLRRRT